jgi:cobalt-zinc-cadmium efflux system protein
MAHSHGHDHEHSHAPAVTRHNERKVLLSFVLIFVFMIVEVVGGLLSGSLALLADAAHMLTDAASLALAYGAFRLGRRGPDAQRTYGYMRFEVLAGFVNAITLIGIFFWITYEAWQRFNEPHVVLAGPMLWVAIIGLLVNILVFWILIQGDKDHVNIKGALLHVLGDLLGSVGAIIAAVAIYFTGWTPIDPILSVLVALLILRSAWSLLRKSLHILLEGAPDHATPDQVQKHLRQTIPDLTGVNHVHVWSITSGRTLATLHIQLADESRARQVVGQVERELKATFDIEHATVAIDWHDDPQPCSLRPENTDTKSNQQHGHHRDHGHTCDHDHESDRGRHHH